MLIISDNFYGQRFALEQLFGITVSGRRLRRGLPLLRVSGEPPQAAVLEKPKQAANRSFSECPAERNAAQAARLSAGREEKLPRPTPLTSHLLPLTSYLLPLTSKKAVRSSQREADSEFMLMSPISQSRFVGRRRDFTLRNTQYAGTAARTASTSRWARLRRSRRRNSPDKPLFRCRPRRQQPLRGTYRCPW